MKTEAIKIKIPWGAWDLNGNWFPNKNLKMTEEEQYQQNVDNGFITHNRLIGTEKEQ